MSRQFCPECGHENPGEARFCMSCGHSLTGEAPPAPAYPPQDKGTDWAGIVAAVLAFLSLRHLSRKARGTVIVVTFLVLFFGCPMVCGFATYVVDSIIKLFQ
jgi:uncharacterized membrane protein YvbJ